jgi:hypothetical protein
MKGLAVARLGAYVKATAAQFKVADAAAIFGLGLTLRNVM